MPKFRKKKRPPKRVLALPGLETVESGGLEQPYFQELGHVSIQTTERYLGCKQKLRDAANDKMGVEPEADR
ncbi:MAG TPA: hypothetical protein VME43_14490 [Bryobacteraceae bacterium]|nr:hypothetical protein [Bryobacteraceae bacterium]